MASAEILIAPATGGESFGIILLEAMVSDCAIIASDIPGYAGVVRNNLEAILVEPGNVDLLRKSLEELILNKPKRDELKENAKKRVKEFSIEKIVENYRDVYESAIELHRSLV